MKKLLPLLMMLLSGFINFAQNQPGQFNYVCDDNNDGYASFLMLEIGSEISGSNPNLVVTHHETQTDATNGANPLPASYTNITPSLQTIFARIVNSATSQVQIITYQLHVFPKPVVTPFTVSVCDDNNDGLAAINLDAYAVVFMNGNPNLLISFHATMQDAEWSANPLISPYVNTTPNMQVIHVRAEDMNTGCYSVTQLYVSITNCEGQPGQPNNLIACSDNSDAACFDVGVNTPLIIGNNNPANYTVNYFTDAALTNQLTSPTSYCPPANPSEIYAKLTNTTTGTWTSTSFSLITNMYQNAASPLQNMAQCDDDANGFISYNLTDVQAQITSGNTLTYYTALVNAQNMSVPITNPAAFNIPIQPATVTLFVRETIVGGCDVIYSINLFNAPNCNAASNCITANPLCGSLGVPFANTVGSPNGGAAGCLNTTPNQTWFYMPISTAGPVNLFISQQSNGVGTDVDYIIYGPFSDPSSPCSNPNLFTANIVSCSYSPSNFESAFIDNALPGQYYLLMVTNFSNQPGYITIVQSNEGHPGAGAIDCNGLKLQAFLDTNTNGIKDSGEQNFPLGQFHYEKNDNGIVHNITAPTGVYSIFDIVPTNSYDVSFSVDPAYSAMYGVSLSSYNNLTIAAGSGISVYNFPVTVVQAYNDLAVTIVPFSAPRPGFTYQNKIIYSNLGNQNIALGTLTYEKDADVMITSITQAGTVTTATGFTYDFTNLAPFESRTMTVTMQVPTIPTVTAGDFLTSTATVAPLSGDVVPENNTSISSQEIINAYDPNDKMEAHGDRILHSTFTPNDYLYYTIRFENTGTASAINVRVNDVLDAQLDETSVRMVSASHAYDLDRVGNSLSWSFDNIQLPVSVANTTIGKGYITFKVKPLPGYAVGDIINNAASIYFDFNPAIVTNMFSTEFVSALGVGQFENNDFTIYPNPTSNLVTVSLQDNGQNIASIRVYDVLGKTVRFETVTDATFNMDVSALNSGMYFVEVTTDTNVKAVKKLMVR